MSLPQALISSLQNVAGFHQKAFEQVHASGEQVTSIRINPSKTSMRNGEWLIPEDIQKLKFKIENKVPWSSFGYYLDKRPSFTFDPLFHAGCYYVQEASSMFLEQALKQIVDLSQPVKILDLCAAPGGKSTHIQSLISPESLLVSNEVIRTRTNVLKQNIIKWGCENVIVTNNDPQHFSKLEGFFDVLVVDAPCSGSGLFRKDAEAINEWSEENVLLCCGRQKRIIADAFACLKENGILIYSTCSYSKNEDEDIADWLARDLKMQNEKLLIEESWGVVETTSEETGSAGYRFFPFKLKGEGFYLTCFRKTTFTNKKKYQLAKPEQASLKEKTIVGQWLKKADMHLLKTPFIYVLPSPLFQDYTILKGLLNIQYAGVWIGEIMKEKLVPDHALALGNLLSDAIPATKLSYEEAIRYLQKAAINIETEKKGWQLVKYEHHNLGWINALPGRINNYYPKELRILKQQDNTGFQK
jgi:16S rRNA C967 or C1407 C5-methylase (RsmB/RsmF family)/NOL1/NOP2/fmu family ribosome biogenesis protein